MTWCCLCPYAMIIAGPGHIFAIHQWQHSESTIGTNYKLRVEVSSSLKSILQFVIIKVCKNNPFYP